MDSRPAVPIDLLSRDLLSRVPPRRFPGCPDWGPLDRVVPPESWSACTVVLGTLDLPPIPYQLLCESSGCSGVAGDGAEARIDFGAVLVGLLAGAG